MNTNFNANDETFMQLAIEEARQSLETGNFPCGAVLVADGVVIGKCSNQKETKKDRLSHAEMQLYVEYSSVLKDVKKQGQKITMYTTLEPCLMCFGTATLHRVDRIVAASPDPIGNMSKLKGDELGEFYTNLPQLEYGLYFSESYFLIREYLLKVDSQESKDYLQKFDDIKRNLQNRT